MPLPPANNLIALTLVIEHPDEEVRMDEQPNACVTLHALTGAERGRFKADLQATFSSAAVDAFGEIGDPIPSDDDIARSLDAPGAVALDIRADGRLVGGAIVAIDEVTGRNSLDFLFVLAREHSRGIGQKAWQAIERRYPKTRLWETRTPYFERRNIHFYVNRCGFKIVEFYNMRHPDPHDPHDEPDAEDAGMFRLEKAM